MTVVNGVDVSSWQHPNGAPIEWEQVKSQGVAFVIVKATQGVDYVSPYYDGPSSHDVTDAMAAGLLAGAYHFAEPSKNTPEAEAAHFLAVAGDESLAMGLWLDLEDLGSMAAHEAGPWAIAFLDLIAPRNPVSGIYTDKSIWSQISATMTGRRLWLANPDPQPGDPVPFILQHGTVTVPGISGQVDADQLVNSRPVNDGPAAPKPAPPAPPSSTAPPTESAPSAPTPPQEVEVQVPTLSEQAPGPGTVSEATRAVQALLLGKAGIPVGGTGIDGRYGNQTALAIRSYQARSGLVEDGICGPATWEHLCTA